jgi:hypothetical protein
MLRTIIDELKEHTPFTALGAVSGIAIMVVLVMVNISADVSKVIFYTMHPAHVVLSALATTAMFRNYRRAGILVTILVGYTGAISMGTLSDALMPYLGGAWLGIEIEFELPFIEEWWLINPAAFLGIAIAYLWPHTKIPHAGHVFLSTWASLFYFTAFGAALWLPLLPAIFVFLFLAVWLPCCASDIVFPLLFSGGKQLPHYHS